MKYLEIIWHDNDFSYSIIRILETLYRSAGGKTLINLSIKNTDIIKTEIIINLLYKYAFNEDSKKREYLKKYFNKMKIMFHKDDKFLKKSCNGEHVYLDLKTGEASNF